MDHFNSVYKRFGVFGEDFPRKSVLERFLCFVCVEMKYSKAFRVAYVKTWSQNELVISLPLLLPYTLRDIF